MTCARPKCILLHTAAAYRNVQTRKLAELVSAYTRETLKATAPHLTERLKVRADVGSSCLERLQKSAIDEHGCMPEPYFIAFLC